MSKKQLNKNDANNPPVIKKRSWLWSLVFVLIAIVSVVAVISQSTRFSAHGFFDYVLNASPFWLFISFLCMLFFIIFEGIALMVACRMFGYKTKLGNGYIYSAADIYFSAITPSSTGGQPASAYFMMKDGIPGVAVTSALLLNLCMYTVSLIVIAAICFIFRFDIFLNYCNTSKLFIICGSIMQTALALFFVMLLINDKLLHRICRAAIRFLCKIKILRNEERKQEKLNNYMDNYRLCTNAISHHKKSVWLILFFNLLQRASQIAVTVFIYMATAGKSFSEAIDLCFLHGYTILGSTFVPLPGGVGVTDFLMLDGFGALMDEACAVNLELLSRSLSFYFCVLICGVSILIKFVLIKKRRKNG